MENPFQPINNRLTNLEGLTLEILQLLRSTTPHTSDSSTDETPLDVAQAADFLNVSKQTIYQNISRIPHRKRHGKLYFFRPELTDYLNNGL